MKPKKDNWGGARPGAGRKPKNGTTREYTSVRILRTAYEAIPDGVNKCDYVSGLIICAAPKNRHD